MITVHDSIAYTIFSSFLLQMFHDTAYSAVCEDDIMDAIDNFLDDSIVLPPGDWDQELLLPVMQERNQLRRRKGKGSMHLSTAADCITPLKVACSISMWPLFLFWVPRFHHSLPNYRLLSLIKYGCDVPGIIIDTLPVLAAQLQEITAEKKGEDPLKHSRRPFGGIWNDLKKLGRRYRSDITDAFNKQVLVSIIFMYIALLGPAIAFGGLMEEITLNTIGETETLLATGLAGVIHGLFAVQPISVLAFTGPVLLFETIIYRVSVNVTRIDRIFPE